MSLNTKPGRGRLSSYKTFPPSNPINADIELKNACHSFSTVELTYAGRSTITPSAV